MRSLIPKIRTRRNPGGSLSFCVDAGVTIGGKRHRKFFRKKEDAQSYAKQLKDARRKQGALAFSLTARQQVDAAEAFKLIDGLNISLTEVATYFIKHARPKGGRKLVSDLAQEFLDAKAKSGKRPRYIKELRCKLTKFAKTFGARYLNEIKREEIEQWLGKQQFSLLTKRNYLRDLGILVRFAMNRGYCADNVIEQIEVPTVPDSDVEIFSVHEAWKLLVTAQIFKELELMPYLAIGLFAGLRASELAALDWDNICLPERTIEVKAATAKTARNRFVTVSDNLHAWLEPYVQLTGSVAPQNLYRRIQKLLKYAELERWPDNGLRHSFGSYHYAMHRNANVTASEMGHESTKMLYRHYRRKVQPKEAPAYWSILPPTGWKMQVPSGATHNHHSATTLQLANQLVQQLQHTGLQAI